MDELHAGRIIVMRHHLGRLVLAFASVLVGGCDRLLGLAEIKPIDAAAGACARDGSGLQFVQSNDANGGWGTTTLDVAFAVAPCAHDLIIVAVSSFMNQVTAVTDSADNTYLMTSIDPVMTSGHGSLWILYANDVATADTFTVHILSTTVDNVDDVLSAAIHDYTNAIAPLPLDQQARQTGTGATTQTSGQVTTMHDGELYFAATTHDEVTTTSSGPGYTLRVDTSEGSNFQPLATEDMIGPTQTTAGTFTTTDDVDWAVGLVTFD